MGFFNYLSDWKASLYEKRIAYAEELGQCPDCSGKGFQIPVINEYFYADTYECPSCNGAGTFYEWYEVNKNQSR